MSAAQYFNQQQPQQNYQEPYSHEQQRGYGQQQQQQQPQYGNQYGGQGGYPQQPQQAYAPPPPNGNYWMKPSQPYAPPSNPPPPQNGGYAENGGQNGFSDTAPFSQATEKTGERFRPKKRLNDPIFLVLFIVAVAGFAVLSGIAINGFISVNGLGGGFGDSQQGGTGSAITLN